MVAGDGARLIGRDDELAHLRGLVDPPPARARVLAVLGEAGMGKTALLAELLALAGEHGSRTLTVTGRESERDLAFAGLHALLRPVLDRLADLPERQAGALRAALALSPDTVAPDALVTGVAVVTLLSTVAEAQPLLVVVDDAQWLDQASLDVLAFAAHRWESEPVVLVLGTRGSTAPRGFLRDVPTLRLAPLAAPEAGRMLDAGPHPPRGRARRAVLAQAGGNPLALIELARAAAADPSHGGRWATEPLPLSEHLGAIIGQQLDDLPGATRTALLVAAVADGTDLTAGGAPALRAAALAPAERAQLIRVGAGGVRFSHPLVRAAVYHGVPFAERAAAHVEVADALRAQPDRRAWHLAAAAWEPDEDLAALLEDSAAAAQRRGGAGAAARALERAAELTPPGPEQVRRLLAAAALALAAGQADWVQDLATRALETTDDPDQRIAARLRLGWASVWSNRHAEALDTLVSVARDAAQRSPSTAWDALGLAGTVVYQSGLATGRSTVLSALDHLGAVAPTSTRSPSHVDEQRAWIHACTDPHRDRAQAVAALHRLPTTAGDDVAKLGATAWLLDETDTAVTLLRQAISTLRAPGVRGQSTAALSALQWACLDSGRFDEAATAAREARDAAAAYRMETVAATADLADATLLALRGDPAAARSLLEASHAVADTAEYLSFAARTRHALGLAALADGDHAAASVHLSGLFDADGLPLHHHVSWLAIADLAHAAVHTERGPDMRPAVEHALARLDPTSGPRLRQLAGRARGLLAEPDDAEAYFRDALADPVGDTWPFERALTRLDLGEWLRRRRRINDAKPVLAAALDTFRALGARSWARRAEAELRACGVSVDAPADGPDRLAQLTSQQREIVLLAAAGLTNGEIADRLFLSPRTVASHLYRSYPRLGVAGRHQLGGFAP